MPSIPVGGVALRKAALNCRPVSAVVHPAAGCLDPLAGGDGRGMADDRDQVTMAAGLQAKHAEPVIGVMERDPLDQPGERLGPRLARARQGGGLHPSPCRAPHRRAQPDAGRATTSASRRLRQSRRRGNDDAAAGVSPAGPSARRISRTREEPPMSKPVVRFGQAVPRRSRRRPTSAPMRPRTSRRR